MKALSSTKFILALSLNLINSASASPANLTLSPRNAILPRELPQDGAVDDLSWIKTIAGVGDSYIAGIGASVRINWACSRYDGSYALTVVRDKSKPNISSSSLPLSSLTSSHLSQASTTHPLTSSPAPVPHPPKSSTNKSQSCAPTTTTSTLR